MARLLRIEFPGAIYHAMSRGIERRALFRDAQDCARFLEELQNCVDYSGIRLYAFCLLGNHYHMLFETPHGNLCTFMQVLQTRYATYFNRRHHRSGHLMQGRYKAKLVEGDEYLLRLSRYIHLNPVSTRAMLRRSLEDRRKALRTYVWSSYRSYIGKGPALKYVSHGPLRALVPAGKTRKGAYRRYVELGLAETDKEWGEVMKRSALAIGSSGFLEQVKGWYGDVMEGTDKKEDVALRRMGCWLSEEEIREVVVRKLRISERELEARRGGGLCRAMLARMLIKYGGWRQREVAGNFGLGSGAAISMALKRLTQVMEEDADWRRVGERVQRELDARMRAGAPGL